MSPTIEEFIASYVQSRHTDRKIEPPAAPSPSDAPDFIIESMRDLYAGISKPAQRAILKRISEDIAHLIRQVIDS